MRPTRIAAAVLVMSGLLAGCTAPSSGATPVPTGPVTTGPTNPILGPSDGGGGKPGEPGKPSPSLEVPPPAY
jgi:hypothetical protein